MNAGSSRIVCALAALLAVACITAPSGTSATAPAAPSANAASAKSSGKRIAPCSDKRAAARLIEDAEDGDGSVLLDGGRSGGWFNYKDEAGSSNVFGIENGGAKGSQRAAHMKGELKTAEVIYAGMGISLGSDPFDASMYKGVAFRARIGAGSSTKVRFTVSDVNTEPAGGVCKNCYNHFGADLTLTSEWADYRFDFEKLAQAAGWGDKFREIVPNAVFSLGWGVNDKGKPYDVWVDDVSFLGCD